MEMLVHTKQAQELCRGLVRRGAPLPLPEQGVEVVGLAERGSFPDVKCLGQSLKMEQATSQLRVGVGDSALGVGIGNKEVGDSLGPWC